MDHRKPAALVVDLLRYKAEHPQRRLAFQEGERPKPMLVPVAPFRPLTPRELEHRQAMVRHLMGHQGRS